MAIAVPASGSCRTAASACSGRRTVRDCTIESYCSKAQRFEAIVGVASSDNRVVGGLGIDELGVAVAVDPAVRLAGLEVVERAVVDEQGHRHVADDHVAVEDPDPIAAR